MKYLSKLSNKQIADFFYSIGIQPYFAVDKNNEILSPIIDGETAKIYKGIVGLSEQEKEEAKLEQMILSKLPMSSFGASSFNKSFNNTKIVLIKMTDYAAYVLDSEEITDLDKTINKNYVEFMNKTFENYEADYNNYVNSLNDEYEK